MKAPDVPGHEGLASLDELLDPESEMAGRNHAFWRNLDRKPLDPSRVGQAEPEARPPEWCEWYRFRPRSTFDDPWVDAARSMLLLDTLSWPAACGPHVGRDFIAPSLDVTTWFYDFAPHEEWLLVSHDAPLAKNGFMGAMGWVHAPDGRLLATGGSHLLCAPAPAGT